MDLDFFLTNNHIFSSTFSALTVCNTHFWISKYSKFIFTWSPGWSVLVCKIPQFLVKSYRFGQFIILFPNFFTLTFCNIHFWIWKYSKFIFMWPPVWSILVCKIPQFLVKSYQFGQLLILFYKFDILRLLKIYIFFVLPSQPNTDFFRLQLMDYKRNELILHFNSF